MKLEINYRIKALILFTLNLILIQNSFGEYRKFQREDCAQSPKDFCVSKGFSDARLYGKNEKGCYTVCGTDSDIGVDVHSILSLKYKVEKTLKLLGSDPTRLSCLRSPVHQIKVLDRDSEIQRKLSESIDVNNPFIFSYFLKKLTPLRTEKDSERTQLYLDVLQKIKSPEAHPCFMYMLIEAVNRDFPSKKVVGKYFHGGPGRLLTEDGIRLLLADLKRRVPVPPLTISGSEAQLRSSLVKVVDEGSGRSGFLYHSGKEILHWTFVFVDRTADKCQVSVVDASQHPQARTIANQIAQDPKLKSCTVYLETSKIKRQMDGRNCPIFAISDYLEWAAHPAGLPLEGRATASGVHEVDILPIDFVKSAQSLGALKEYLTTAKDSYDPESFRKLESEIERSTVTLSKTTGSFKAEKLRQLAAINPVDRSLVSAYDPGKSFSEGNEDSLLPSDPLNVYGRNECFEMRLKSYYDKTPYGKLEYSGEPVPFNARIHNLAAQSQRAILQSVLDNGGSAMPSSR